MDDQEAESRQGFLSDEHKTFRYDEKQERWVLPWTFVVAVSIFSTSICIILLAYIFTALPAEPRPEELGYPKFSTVQRQFTGGLKYDETGELFLDGGEESKRYIGNSSSVDEAWNEFDAVQNIELDPGEVSVKGLYIDARNKAITIPDVFHQLHCLNQIRIALYDPQYLTNENTKRRLHVDHCIDYLRQNIQCRADLTPLRVFYSKPAQRMMVDFEGMHTCKDFDAVLRWAWEHHASYIGIHER